MNWAPTFSLYPSRNFSPTLNLFQSQLYLKSDMYNQIGPLLILLNLQLLFRKLLLNPKIGNLAITVIYRLNVGAPFIRLEPITNL